MIAYHGIGLWSLILHSISPLLTLSDLIHLCLRGVSRDDMSDMMGEEREQKKLFTAAKDGKTICQTRNIRTYILIQHFLLEHYAQHASKVLVALNDLGLFGMCFSLWGYVLFYYLIQHKRYLSYIHCTPFISLLFFLVKSTRLLHCSILCLRY